MEKISLLPEITQPNSNQRIFGLMFSGVIERKHCLEMG